MAALRSKLRCELEILSVPIVVLIDEVDRVEDEEVRAVAQLVRSVADFPGISYVLAYDTDRVIQALGAGADEPKARTERGTNYLEKIVQLQIPLPVTFSDEILRMLRADLTALSSDLDLPTDLDEIERYTELESILIEKVIRNPRDIRRIIGTFHVLAAMVKGEVDWIDVLGYSALLIKSPAIVAKMQSEPDDFVTQPQTEPAIIRRMALERTSPDERIKAVVPETEQRKTEALLKFLFPWFSGDRTRGSSRTDPISERRPFLTLLRLGLIPGAYSREQIIDLLNCSEKKIQSEFQDAFARGGLAQLTDRLNDLYADLEVNHLEFWNGVAAFAKKPDCDWLASYLPMGEAISELARVLERAVARRYELRSEAAMVIKRLLQEGERELVSRWLRTHFLAYGIFGWERRDHYREILSREEVETAARSAAKTWHEQYLEGEFIPCLWSLHPVYLMRDVGVWDEDCKEKLDDILTQDCALDGFTMMLFGAGFTTEQSSIEQFCDYERFIERVRDRLETDDLSETARFALEKALRKGV